VREADEWLKRNFRRHDDGRNYPLGMGVIAADSDVLLVYTVPNFLRHTCRAVGSAGCKI
jgi:hypothetical protein